MADQEIIPDDLELKAIPDDRVFALRAAKALLGSRPTNATKEPGLEASPARTCGEPEEHRTPVLDQPGAKAATVRKRRAMAISGAVIVSQDGERVRFKKKCVRCGFEDSCKSVLRIMSGINNQVFFCPKCRKQVAVSIRGV